MTPVEMVPIKHLLRIATVELLLWLWILGFFR
jgi:hypothetical protein